MLALQTDVIHTVGPIGEKPWLLESAYKKCLEIVKQENLRSVVSHMIIVVSCPVSLTHSI